MSKIRYSSISPYIALSFFITSGANAALAQSTQAPLLEIVLFNDSMTVSQFQTCMKKDAALNELRDDLKSTAKQREHTVKTINKMSDGYGRRTLIKAAKNLKKIYREDERKFNKILRSYKRNCERINVNYEVFKEACGKRRYLLREGSYCDSVNEFPARLKKEKGWR
jgi:hypothetical protein